MGVRLDVGRGCGGNVGHLVGILSSLGRLVPPALFPSSGKYIVPEFSAKRAAFSVNIAIVEFVFVVCYQDTICKNPLVGSCGCNDLLKYFVVVLDDVVLRRTSSG